MYIKLIFKREQWCVPNSNEGVIDGLFKAPTIVEKLPNGVQAGVYHAVPSQFVARNPEYYTFYLDCGKLRRHEIEAALNLFEDLYDCKRRGMPGAMIGLVAEENEIIANLKIALENVLQRPDDRQPYLRNYSMSGPEDIVRILTC